MKKELLTGLAGCLFFLGSISVGSASTTVTLDFEDLYGTYWILPTNYGGLTWDSGVADYWGKTDGHWEHWNVSTYAQAKSGEIYLYNNRGPHQLGFNFTDGMNSVGAWFGSTSSSISGSPIQMVGYVGSVATYFSPTLDLTRDMQYLSISSSLNDITRVVIYTGLESGGWYAMDDLTFTGNSVPLPGAVWLLGSGLAGLVAVRRKRK